MATVSISLYQKRETTESGYRVISEITSSAAITPQLFVFKYVDGTGPQWLNNGADIYQHVATVQDVKILHTPTSFPYTPTTLVDYYLYTKSVLDYGSLAGAIDQAAITKTRLGDLAEDWQVEIDTFESSIVYFYQSEDGQVSFDLQQVQSQQAADNYRVLSTIQPGPVGISRELFLYEKPAGATPDPTVDTYVRVATTDDLGRWPTRGAWVAEDYYRSEYAQVDNVLLNDAVTHSTAVLDALEALAQDYDTASDDFEGEETTVYTA